MQLNFSLNGGQDLEKALTRKARAADRDVKNIVRKHGAALNRKMVKNASFTKGYSTGATRRSIRMELTNGGLTVTVRPGTDYAMYVEFGTRFMASQSFVRPAFYSERMQFIDELRRLVR
ncbi:hypothetical protein J18TS1_12570 [Oceanobacillus oncorhynchi subsp. incaldanensis]|uniref:HK97-gp10 family putative phage morphogenesis protein n=1 Tax=Oceanobacillus oncorhynchi TaxID=545501 RepID=UPI001B0CEA1E|nr:HK97-gp10 family putative phage morphogenesis protein [Oceanobacillus oncorhynchi]GIO18157.1 hypothetical protein J18TS1_12570 [Oceanobacillus oncorhynchi subsp. incaldanensis]